MLLDGNINLASITAFVVQCICRSHLLLKGVGLGARIGHDSHASIYLQINDRGARYKANVSSMSDQSVIGYSSEENLSMTTDAKLREVSEHNPQC